MSSDLLATGTGIHRRHAESVAEASDGRVVAFEIKAARSIAANAFKGLRHLRDRVDSAGGRFVAGVVLYLGDDALPAGHRLAALPLSHLWRSPGQ